MYIQSFICHLHVLETNFANIFLGKLMSNLKQRLNILEEFLLNLIAKLVWLFNLIAQEKINQKLLLNFI